MGIVRPGRLSVKVKIPRTFWERNVLRSTAHFVDEIRLAPEADIGVILWSRLSRVFSASEETGDAGRSGGISFHGSERRFGIA